MQLLVDPQAWIAFLTLTFLEIVLGVDNIIFISILVGRLPEAARQRARVIGLGLAMGMRIVLLLAIGWVMKLTTPMFEVFDHGVSGRDLILLLGGLFLIGKSTLEIHHSLEGEHANGGNKKAATFGSILIQIALLDLVFSLDSVITAVGMVDKVPIMIAAVMVAVGVMMVAAKPIGEYVERHPTMKMLALSFLVLIGFVLFLEGLHLKDSEGDVVHVPKGYIYFAMGFSLTVELLNTKLRKKRPADPVKLRKSIEQEIADV